MNKIKVKLLTLTLAVIVAGTTLTACKKSNNSETEVAKTNENVETISLPLKEPITLKVWGALNGNLAQTYSNLGDTPLYKELAKRTGITLKYTHPAIGQEKEQFNLMIASRDLPDLFDDSFANYSGGHSKAYSDQVLIKMNDIMKYAPDFQKVMDAYPDVKREISSDDGSIFYMPFIRGEQLLRTYHGPYMRKDWLDDLGLKPPTTVDEWYTVLKAFKEKKAATAPLLFGISATNYKFGNIFAGAYGISYGYFVEDGKVKFGAADPRYKDLLTTYAKWYSEGLIDPEFATNNGKTIDAKITNGEAGASWGSAGGTVGKYLSLMKDKDPKYSLIGVQYPSLKPGEPVKFLQQDGLTLAGGSFAISTSNKYPKESMALLNYGYTKEGYMLYNFGIEGESYKIDNGYPKYTELITKNPNGLAMANVMPQYMRSMTSGPFVQDRRYVEQYYQFKQQTEALQAWTKFAGETVGPKSPNLRGKLTAEEVSSIASKDTEINTYVDEMFVKFVMGQEPLSKFDQYLAQLKKMGIDEAIKVRQDSHDRFIKANPDVLTSTKIPNVSDLYTK